jgi:RIO-like serine/threonine protein kinase
MKNCYFYQSSDNGIWVQSKKKTMFIDWPNACVTHNQNKKIVSIKDVSKNIMYYPVPGYEFIQ